MSDFLTELRAEVLDTHAAHRRRGRARRAIRRRVFGRRPALAAGIAVALVAAALALRATAPPPTTSPRVVDVIRVGGAPTDAVRVGRSVWVADATGRRVIELDTGSRRVVKRTRVGGQPVAVTAGAESVWVRTSLGDGGAVRQIGGARTAQVGYGATLAAGPNTIWAADVELPPEGITRSTPAPPGTPGSSTSPACTHSPPAVRRCGQ